MTKGELIDRISAEGPRSGSADLSDARRISIISYFEILLDEIACGRLMTAAIAPSRDDNRGETM